MSDLLYKQVKQAAKRCRDEEARKKIELFLRAFEVGSVLKACQELGTYGRFYYYWWNRFRDSGFKIESLQEKSRRPKNSPRQVEPQVVEWIKHYRENLSLSSDKIQLALLKEKKVKVSKSTVYRVILKEGLPLKKKRSAAPQLRTSAPFPSPSRERSEGEEARIIGDRYLVERELGSGGGGIVYLAQDQKQKGRQVALKVLETKNPTLAASLKNEFLTLASLHHRNLAKVFDFAIDEHEMYFTSEWIDGQDILQSTEKANLNTVFHLIVQILRALDFLHRRGVLHLDLKPSNILVTDPDRTGDLTVKLIDFGSAEWRKKGMKLEGEFVGTPPYAAPEIILEQAPSPASDLYALGMVLHQIFGRRFPLEANEPFEMMKEQLYGSMIKITDLNPALPEEFSDYLLKMVEKKPSERFSSASEALKALNRCLGETYTLRSAAAPVHILEESDHFFREGLLHDLLESFSEQKPQVTLLSGLPGMGKSDLVNRMKESLQLRGIHPRLLQDAQALDEFLHSEDDTKSAPLLIDLHGEEPDLNLLLDTLENLSRPVLMTTRLTPFPKINPTRWIELKALSPEEVGDFLSKEIADFPHSALTVPITRLSEGSPPLLEKILQALREEGAIQWSDQGWKWWADNRPDLHTLLSNHEARWEERFQKIGEVLKFSSVGMNAKTLEGVLGLEPGSLEAKLQEWEKTGRLVSKRIRKIPRYFLPVSKISQNPEKGALQNWPWMEKELERLYGEGAFEAGVQWAALLEADPTTRNNLPPRVALLGARHYVSAGHAEKALLALPSSVLHDPKDRGLDHEIRGRAFFALGRFEESLKELKEAESFYRSSEEAVGLSRVFNLYGSVHRKQGNFAAAERSFIASIRTAEKVNAFYQQGMARMNLAVFYQDQGQFQRAYTSYSETFPLDQKADAPLLSCKLRQNWVNLLFFMGRSAEAEQACYELLQLSVKHRYPEQQAGALNFLALLAGQKNHSEMQLDYLNQALSLLDPTRFPKLVFDTLIIRGYLYESLKKFTPAQLDGEAALQLAERLSNTNLLPNALLLLGRVLRDRPKPDLEEATRCLNNAHQWILKNQIGSLLWSVEFERGLTSKKKGERLRAKNYFLSAKSDLENLLKEVPEFVKQSYLRDRKLEQITNEIQWIDQEMEKKDE